MGQSSETEPFKAWVESSSVQTELRGTQLVSENRRQNVTAYLKVVVMNVFHLLLGKMRSMPYQATIKKTFKPNGNSKWIWSRGLEANIRYFGDIQY